MNENLGISINPLVKLIIGNLCVVDVDLMRHYKAWLCLARDDQVAKISIVGLDVALSSTD